MVKILGTGNTADGQSYVVISKTDWEQFASFRVLFDFARTHSQEEFRESLKGMAKDLGENFPEEFKYLIERDPWAARYLKQFLSGNKGRPEALNASQRDFIARNDDKTGKALYEHLRAEMGYTGSLKTVQNELSKRRYLNQTIEL